MQNKHKTVFVLEQTAHRGGADVTVGQVGHQADHCVFVGHCGMLQQVDGTQEVGRISLIRRRQIHWTGHCSQHGVFS